MTTEIQYILENTAKGNIDKKMAAKILAAMKKNTSLQKEDIAIIGLSAKMPEAETAEEFWQNIANKKDGIRHFPEKRKKDTDAYLSYMGKKELVYEKAGYLNEIDQFDYHFFGISPKEAELMDPNQRLFLQTAWQSIEDAGYGGDRLVGSRTGVYVGYDNSTVNAYRQMISDVDPSLLSLATAGNILPIIASRISYLLDLHGPSMLIDTTCSSSLLAVHMACQSIQNKECDMAIAGSVKISMLPVAPKEKLGVEATDGKAKTFDDRSDGTGIGEGVGAVVLKPLKKAMKDGDSIYAVIKGGAANHDGNSIGLTAPNMLAQEDVISKALKDANVSADSISYIEAHGTGTRLGDPIEIGGITRAFKKQTNKKQFCAISSLKTNIGHLDHGAGIASLIKAVMALKHKKLPPMLHFEIPNRDINFLDSPVYVNDRLKDWDVNENPRRCGVSSFGLSGTNCHLILEEAPQRENDEENRETTEESSILTLSAKSETALKNIVKRLNSYVKTENHTPLGDICYTAAVGRGHYSHRISLLVQNRADLEEKLLKLEINPFSNNPKEGIFYQVHSVTSSSRVGREPGEITETEKRQQSKEAEQYLWQLTEAPELSYEQREELLKRICSLYTNGADIDWNRLYHNKGYRRVNLPAYPFDLHRCWLSTPNHIQKQTNMIMSSTEMHESHTVHLIGEIEENLMDRKVLQEVANVWAEVLGLKEIHVRANLFELGGDSIFATKIVGLLNKKMECNIDIADLMRNVTLEKFAYYIQTHYLKDKETKKVHEYREILPVEKAEYYPATSAQNRLYILDKMVTKSISYNLPNALIIEGALDIPKLENAFTELISKHETLRTSFEMLEDQLIQRIHQDFDFSLNPLICEEEEIGEEIQKFIQPFDLSKAPLLRAGIANLSSNKYVLFFDIHHIICDGASTEILLKDLINAYNTQLSPMNIQYKDYAVWQNELAHSKVMQEQEAFWKETLSGELPTLKLPYDYTRPAIQQFVGEKVSFELNEDTLIELKGLAQQSESTLFMVLLSLFNVFISKYSAQEDIIIGSPISGRNHADLQDIIGMFVNTLAMRNYPTHDKTFIDFLKEVRNNALMAYDHQDYSFEELVKVLDIPRDLSRNPLFDVMFIMQNVGVNEVLMEDLIFKQYDFDSKVSKVDLTMNVMEKANGLSIDFEYASSLFKRETIARMAENFNTLVRQILDDPYKILQEYNFVSEAESALISTFNQTESFYEKDLTVHQLFERQVIKTPYHTALVFGDKVVTYQELNDRSNQLASHLLKQGVKSQDIVAIMVPRSIEVFISMLAVLKVGAAYLPIDPEYPQDRIQFMLEDSEAKLLIQYDQERKIPFSKKMINLADRAVFDESNVNKDINVSSNQLAYVIYTSGSTGKPKGVMVEHEQVHNFIHGITNLIDFHSEQTLLSLTTICFDIFVLESLLALSKGMKVVIASEEEQINPRLLGESLTENHVDMLQITPSRLKLLLDTQKGIEGIKGVKTIMLGGEALPKSLLKELKTFKNLRIFNMYGPTETTVWSTVMELTNQEKVTIGKPISNTQIYIVDKFFKPLPIGIPGDLLIGGDGVTRGYLNRPDLNAERFIVNENIGKGRLYQTGDIARWLPNGEIEFLGREDQLVKLRGHRIELGEIETLLLSHEAIKDAAVIVKNDQLCAFYISKKAVTRNQLKDFLEAKVPYYMVPNLYISLEEMPQTQNGKTDRKALLKVETFSNNHEKIEKAKPANELQEKLAHVWQDILQTEEISVDDNFFALGGNSMKAIQIMAKTEDIGIKLLMNDIFKYQSIRELEQYIRISGKANQLIDHVDEAQRILSEELKQKILIIPLHVKEKHLYVYYLEFITKDIEKRVIELVQEFFSSRIYPHQILPLEKYKALQGELTWMDRGLDTQFATVNHHIFEQVVGRKSLQPNELISIIENIQNAHFQYEESILSTEIIKEYRLAPIEMFFLGSERFSGTLLRFDNLINLELFNKAVSLLIRQQGVFRNTLITKNGKLYWREFDCPDELTIPFLNISHYSEKDKEQILQEIVSNYFFLEYEEWDKLYYRFLLVQENLREFYLFLPVNHSIFDAMSGEVVKRNLLEYYEQLENGLEIDAGHPGNYLEYVEQVRKGPVGMTDDEIIEAFHLDQYQSITKALNVGLSKYKRDKSTYLKFEIRTKNKHLEFDSDNSWEIAFALLKQFMEKYLGIKSLPVSVFYYGRVYEDKKFFNTVGEFIDLIPMLVDESQQSVSEMANFVQSRIALAEKHNLNFSNLAINEKLDKKYPKVRQFIKTVQQDSSIIFNFQGKLEDQEMDSFEKLLYKRLMYELNMEEAVNIYFATRYSNDVIQIDISLPFDEDENKLIEFFQGVSTAMDNLEVQKYE